MVFCHLYGTVLTLVERGVTFLDHPCIFVAIAIAIVKILTARLQTLFFFICEVASQI